MEEVTREAFWNQYAPGCDEHYPLHRMRAAEAFVPELSLVAEAGEPWRDDLPSQAGFLQMLSLIRLREPKV